MLGGYRRFWILVLVFSLALYFPKPGVTQQSVEEKPIAAQEEPAASPEGEPAPATEGESSEMSQQEAQNISYGLGSVFASAFYSPLKVTYAGLGLITGGLGYVLSGGRRDVADNIIYPAVRGSYVITPTQLKGAKPVIFVASPPQPAGQPQQTTASDPDSPPKN